MAIVPTPGFDVSLELRVHSAPVLFIRWRFVQGVILGPSMDRDTEKRLGHRSIENSDHDILSWLYAFEWL